MTSAFGGQHSIQLSYGCLNGCLPDGAAGFNGKGDADSDRRETSLCATGVTSSQPEMSFY